MTPTESEEPREYGWCLDPSTGPPYKGFATYEDPYGRFSFEYPENWQALRYPTSRRSTGYLSSFATPLPEGCTRYQTMLPGMTRVDVYAEPGSRSSDCDHIAEHETMVDGIPAVYSIWRRGDPASDVYSEASISDFKIMGWKVTASVCLVRNGTLLALGLFSGSDPQPELGAFWHMIESWRSGAT